MAFIRDIKKKSDKDRGEYRGAVLRHEPEQLLLLKT